MTDEDRRGARSAAWGVTAGVFCTGTFATWPKALLPDWSPYVCCVAFVLALYLCFAEISGWWPTPPLAGPQAAGSASPPDSPSHARTRAESKRAGGKVTAWVLAVLVAAGVSIETSGIARETPTPLAPSGTPSADRVPMPASHASPMPSAGTSVSPRATPTPTPTPTPPAVLLPTPAGWWKLNDDSGTVAADAVPGAAPAVGSNITWCQSGNCAAFNGTDADFVTDGPVVNTGIGASFTVAAWVWMYSAPAAGGSATIVSQDAATNSGFYLQFIQYAGASSGSWAFSRSSSDTSNPVGYRATSDQSAALRTWTFLVGVFNGATNQLELYVDGLPQHDIVNDPTPYAAAGGLAVGRALYGGQEANWYPGLIDNVEVWNTALSGSQIKLLSEAPA